jgi:hypothetical protein
MAVRAEARRLPGPGRQGAWPDAVEERQPAKRFEPLLDALPSGFVFDGEIVALDGDGRPRFGAMAALISMLV